MLDFEQQSNARRAFASARLPLEARGLRATHPSSRSVIGRCLLLLSHDEEILFSHVADVISVLVDEN